MTENVAITKIDEVNVKVHCSNSLAKDITEIYTFMVPGYQHMPKFKAGFWDGKIRLFSFYKRLLPTGLAPDLRTRLLNEGYNVTYDPDLEPVKVDVSLVAEFLRSQSLKFKPRDYQLKALLYALREKRCLLVSPTASGKSLIIHLLAQWYKDQQILIVVPKIDLVNQMTKDFMDYDLSGMAGKEIQKIVGGETKDVSKRVVISTWQSIWKLEPNWFEDFGVVIGDECHRFKANCLKEIMDKLQNTKYRYGLTGTLDQTETNEMVLRGQFGAVNIVTTTKELTDRKEVAKLHIKSLVLSYPPEVIKSLAPKGKRKWDYNTEIEFLFGYEPRNKFIRKLALTRTGNTLIIFKRVEHGKALHERLLKDSLNPVYLVHGKVDSDEREDIRQIVNTHRTSITLATDKCFSEGINIPNLNNIIFAAPSKSRINVLQSIGRVLRKTEIKDFCRLYDICDDLTFRSWKNYSLEHYLERARMYEMEHHDNQQIDVGIIK